MGHDASNCNKTKNPSESSMNKKVLEVKIYESSNDKYKIAIKVNDIITICQVDLGSQATLVRESDAIKLG